MMCLASCVEENRFDLEATLGTLVGAAGGAPVPKTETELKRGGANNNPNISKDTTRLSRAGLETRAKHGKSAAGLSKGMRVTGRVLNTVAVPLLVFEGFYDWGTIGRCAVVCTGE
ncbi:hypothetical protein [Marinagarivorans algicola]|uniref:hypothetical protein n=1 Tax=Marinagarivorans algicola TaxID=1513270 RepID=UPI00373566D5